MGAMARPNEEVEALLQEYADLLSITGGDPFKARAYEKAARSIGGYPTDVTTLDVKGLKEIPGVGTSIAQKVAEYVRTGSIAMVEEQRTAVPAGVRQLTRIPTLGPKKAMTLYEELRIASVEELADAIHAGRLEGLHFDRLYNNFGAVVPADAKAVVRASADRHAAWTDGLHDDETW